MRHFLQSAAFSLATLAALTFATPSVLAQEDVTPPTLLSMTYTPTVIDASAGPVTMTFTIHVQDDLSGMASGGLYFHMPGTTQVHLVQFDSRHLVEGDATDGFYQAEMVLPQYMAHGRWEAFEVFLKDNVGNSVWWHNNFANVEWPELYNEFTFWVGPEQSPTLFWLLVPALSREE